MRNLALACLLGLVVVLSGCTMPGQQAPPAGDAGTSPPPPPPPQDAWRTRGVQDRLRAAEHNLERDLGPTGGIAQLSAHSVEPSGNGSEGPPAGAAPSVRMDIELGSNGVTRFSFDLGGFLQAAVFCSTERSVLQLGDQVLEGRARDDETCTLMDREQPTSEEVLASSVADDGVLIVTIREHDPDGNVSNVTLTIDAQDRVQAFAETDEQGTMLANVTYAARQPVAFPPATGRQPASVGSMDTFEGNTYTWTATTHDDNATLADFRVRVRDSSLGPESEPLAEFHPSDPAVQTQGNFTFRFVDDGDGNLSTDDTFTLTNPAWVEEFAFAVEVWDAWAEAPLGALGMPFPALLAPAALGLAAVLLGRGSRRKRGG